ncbi:MAG: hypothetical protein ACRCXB_31070 [Aeromonadaceae bacterium]
MAQKEYLKMADVFVEQLCVREKSPRLLDCCGALAANFLNEPGAKYAAHAINSHDELVADVERLRGALTSSRLALSNAAMNMKWFDISKAQEILREVNSIDKLISAIGTSDAKI